MRSNDELYDLLTTADCYEQTVHEIDKGKVVRARQGETTTQPRSKIGIVAWELAMRAHGEESGGTNIPPTVLFGNKYAYVRDPRSGSETEKMAELAKAGYGCVALNVGDHPPTAWSGWRSLGLQNNIPTIPWARCTTTAQIDVLMDTANKWSAPGVIVNLEQNSGMPRWSMTGEEAAKHTMAFKGTIGISTEPYMPENFNWLPLIQRGAIDLPQCSILEFPTYTPEKVVARATSLFGWPLAIPSFATYDFNGTPKRSDYVWSKNFGIYTVDDLTYQEIKSWA